MQCKVSSTKHWQSAVWMIYRNLIYTLLCRKKHVILSSCNVFVHAMSTPKAWATLGPKTINEVITMQMHWPRCGQQGALWPMKETKALCGQWKKQRRVVANKALCGQWKKQRRFVANKALCGQVISIKDWVLGVGNDYWFKLNLLRDTVMGEGLVEVNS